MRRLAVALSMIVIAALVAPLWAAGEETEPAQSTEPQPPVEEAGDANAGYETAADDAGTVDEAAARAAEGETPHGHTGSAHAAASRTVRIFDFGFSPATVTIDAGDTLTWRNDGPTPHSATADDGSFDTGTFGAGQSRSHTFRTAGTFAYHCTPHPSMRGTVRVRAAAEGEPSSAAAPTEAEAVASPDAAGSSTRLPATGSEVLPLAVAGALLLIGGALVPRRRRDAR